MKYVIAVWWLCLSCASAKNQYAYQELEQCPAAMSEEQHYSGVVRCRALCSSYGRDFAEFGADCRCYCAPAPHRYRPAPHPAKPGPPLADGQPTWM